MDATATAPRPWLWPNLLSLDAPIVALLWQLLFARCFHASVSVTAAILLVLAVWLIYAADRVLDARDRRAASRATSFTAGTGARSCRCGPAVLVFAGWLAWTRLPAPIFERGVLLLAAVGLYLLAVHVVSPHLA